MAAAPANRTRTMVLLGVLAVLVAWVLIHRTGSSGGAKAVWDRMKSWFQGNF